MKIRLVSLAILGIGAVALLGAFLGRNGPSFSEAQTIASGITSFDQLSGRFSDLAKKKGALYAYEILRRAQLPPGTDVHLLGHTVGDILYQQKGVAGIADCTQEFRNACSHAIVIGALNDFGDAALPKIHDACAKAPGGSGAYTMCYHGLGHGVFAFFKYDLPQTVAFCKKTGTQEYHDEEYIQCMGGVTMELMGGGGHDHEDWVKAREKYLSSKDPLAPCDTASIPSEAKGFCYTYITPHLFEYAGADLADPQPEHFKKAFEYCDRIAKSRPGDRHACFSGVGKEFPLLAVARDTRALMNATDAELTQMRVWCSVAPHAEAYKDCTDSLVDSLFWGGENDPNLSVRFCSQARGGERSECFGYLSNIAEQYLRDASARERLCSLYPADVTKLCETPSS